jgi:hypothetical protein
MSKQIIELLNQGILPDELNFSEKTVIDPIDWAKVKYNTFYKSSEFYESKFPEGFKSIPGFDKVIDNIVVNGKTPLEEITERQSIKNDD